MLAHTLPPFSPAPKQRELNTQQLLDNYVRPYYLPGSFAVGSLTFGLRTALLNFDFGSDVSDGVAAAHWLVASCCRAAPFALSILTYNASCVRALDPANLLPQPLGFLGSMVVSGLLIMALAWVLFDLVSDEPPQSGRGPV